MNDTTTERTPTDTPSAPALTASSDSQPEAPPRQLPTRASATAAIALLLSLLALGLLGLQWYTSRSTLEALRHDVAKRLAEGDVRSKESRTAAEQAREAVAEAQVKLGILETRVAESQSQQIALESLYQELSRNRDEWALADIEQSLLVASQQLQLAGNIKAALIALQNADARLQRMERPQLTPLRKAINRDLERLKALPYVDIVGASVKLDTVVAAVDTLPLSSEVRPPLASGAATPAREAEASPWRRFMREAWSELKQLVRVQHMDRPDIPLLAPEQGFFLRENLKLRLLGARLALLSRDQASYRSDLAAAREWIGRYYDTRDKSVGTALATLRSLHESEIEIALPEIAATLDALRNLRLARDRPVR